MKKKILALVLIVAMLGVALIGGTLAYFTDKEVEDNEFVIGDIDINLKENNGLDENDPNYAEGEDYQDWLADQTVFPGLEIAKNVWIENAGDNEAYVRLKITFPANFTPIWSDSVGTEWQDVAYIGYADDSFTEVLNYYAVLPAGQKTPICLKGVTVDPFLDKQLNGAEIQTVNVVAEAIQTVGFANAEEAFAALDKQLIVNEYKGKNYIEAADGAALQEAIDDARDGDVIVLESSIDYGTITIDSSLNNVAIVGSGFNDIIEINIVDGASLTDVTVANLDVLYQYDTANGAAKYRGVIDIQDGAYVDNLVIRDCAFDGWGNRAAGVSINDSDACVVIENCTFDGMVYAVYGPGVPAESLTLKNCTFNEVKSWVVRLDDAAEPDSELTIAGCTFTECKGGVAKYFGSADTVFTFTDNTLTDCAGHDGEAAKWFNVTGAAVASGNTLDGAAWTPTAAQGFGG